MTERASDDGVAEKASEPSARELQKAARLRLKERAAALREQNETLREAKAALREQNETLREANAALRERNAALRKRLQELDRRRDLLAEELADLRGSYYLSGARKKLNLAELPTFSAIANRVMAEGRSGMHYDRFYALWQAVKDAPSELPLIEIGSFRGGSAKFIAETLRATDRSPQLYVCDTFAGHPRTDPGIDLPTTDGYYFQDTSAQDVAQYLGDHPNVEFVVGDIMETSRRFAHEVFGFVHVDVDLYAATDHCLRFFAPRMAQNAVMVIDDYGVVTCPGAQKAVDDFIAETDEFRLIHLLSGQAILFRTR